jgi:predicted short-subunit dehydrogenase-like oxidoreductase (DUF2520 family)
MTVKRRVASAQSREHRAIKKETTINIIGAGRMGTALAIAVSSRGYKIEALVTQRKARARRAARLIGAQPLILTSGQLNQLPESDILLITTPDDRIESVAEQIAASHTLRVAKSVSTNLNRMKNHRRTALHASGALSSEVLRALRDVGYSTGSLHPLISVSDSVQGAQKLSSAFFCIEGERAAQRVARSLVRALGAQSFSINTEDKALYHAAAVMASGHVTALFDIATDMLAHCGLNEKRARAVLLPLLQSALENLYTNDPAQALTGTFARADITTVRKHLAALRSSKLRDARAAYTLLGLHSLQLAQAAGARSRALEEIKRLLEKDTITV